VLVDDFKPTRSQRRVLKRWGENYRIEYGPPVCSGETLRLFNKHKDERNLREEGSTSMTEDGYAGWLMNSCFHTMEMRYFFKDRLVGVGILDLGEVAVSSVYFFFDPDSELSKLSPGVFSALQEIEFCRATGRKYLYLGLYVRKCSELSYKRNYYPHERVEQGTWTRHESSAVDPHNTP
jgi:arginine-tRNA-protein transferase